MRKGKVCLPVHFPPSAVLHQEVLFSRTKSLQLLERVYKLNPIQTETQIFHYSWHLLSVSQTKQ